MWRFIAGLTSGVYLGTYYDCKPIVNKISEYIKEQWPAKKE
tara:strand:- start:2512 stop:2634 length:123 start_codon:yes stop_codon:yes gene_type:complete